MPISCSTRSSTYGGHAAVVLTVSEAGGGARLLDGRAYEPMMTEGRLLVASGSGTLAALGETFSAALESD